MESYKPVHKDLPFSISNAIPEVERPAEVRRSSAVCLLFRVSERGQTEAILTKRTLHVSSHKGQISLPGGHIEPSDASIEAAALRETEEEIGVPTSEVEIVAHLPKIHGLDGRSIYPVVGLTKCKADDIQVNKDEVEEVLFIPWKSLSRPQVEKFTFVMFGIKRESHLYRHGKHNIWGITANIIYRANLSPA